MKVKVSFDVLPFFGHRDTSKSFPLGFSTLSIVPFEPVCPFCGNYLENALCCCEKYADAIAKFKALYTENISNVSIEKGDGILLMATVFIKDMQITMTAVSPSQKLFTLFDEGGIVKFSSLESDVWFVSSGELNNNCVKFYIRKKNSEEIQLCSVSGFRDEHISQLSTPETINLCKYERTFIPHAGRRNIIGNYTPTIEKSIITSLPYDEFLQKLQKL